VETASYTEVRLMHRFYLLCGLLVAAHVFVVAHDAAAYVPWSCAVIDLVEWLGIAALVWRARRTPVPTALRWWLVIAAMAFVNVANNIYLLLLLGVGQNNPAPGAPMFCYALYGIAMILAITMTFRKQTLTLTSCIDALMALVMAGLFFVRIFSWVSASGTDNLHYVNDMIVTMDVLSLFITLCAFTRLAGAVELDLRHFYFAVAFYCAASTVVAAIRNRLILHSQTLYLELLVLIAPILLGVLCLRPLPHWMRIYQPRPRVVYLAESISPFFLGLGLTALSISLWTTRPVLAALGVGVAIVGYGIRNVITQSQQMASERELLDLRDELEGLVVTDPLTGVANRRGFDRQLASLWTTARSDASNLSILMIDIDYFKRFNDDHGHAMGDHGLRVVAAGLSEWMRPHRGGVLARYGGEEFAVLLPGIGYGDAIAAAESLREGVEGLRVDTAQGPLGITISIGVASSSQTPTETAKGLLALADKALLEAKASGRNKVMAYG
jgi:diguanylate cyclase (GGDEF)-like protein